ncbi:MAG: hypothetical protein PWP39_1663 [Pyrococcus sp.]|uniref:hypothetical protein n=1 Tax=Pyrococcus sp. TaxID=33866 RepID=UPI002590DF21|nr:hypothetical protein [Pyrococcus sp.]MDK2870428.1 hypothetical protein [Pyrococcus sp.]
MRKIVRELSEKEVGGVKEEEIFWEFKVKREPNLLYLYLFPRKEWGLKLEGYVKSILIKVSIHEVRICREEIKEKLQTVNSFKDCFIYSDKIELEFEDNPNIHEDIKSAIIKLNELIKEEREKLEKIEKALERIARPKTESD